jgi:hypothetical protein
LQDLPGDQKVAVARGGATQSRNHGETAGVGKAAHGMSGQFRSIQLEQDVGRDTALRAIDILRSEGLVLTVPRRGTYVSTNAK